MSNRGFTVVEQIAAIRSGIDILDLEDVQLQYFQQIYRDEEIAQIYYDQFTQYQEDLFQQLAQEIQSMQEFGITRTEFETYGCDRELQDFLKPEPEKSQISQQIESQFDVNNFLDGFKKQLQAEITRGLREQQREEKMLLSQKKLSKIQKNQTPNLLISQLPFEGRRSKLAEIRSHFPENYRLMEEQAQQNTVNMKSALEERELNATVSKEKETNIRRDRMFQASQRFQEHQDKITNNLKKAQQTAALVQQQQEWLISLDEQRLAEHNNNTKLFGMEATLRAQEERAQADQARFAKFEEMQDAKMKQIQQQELKITQNVEKIKADQEGKMLSRKEKMEQRHQMAQQRLENYKQELMQKQQEYMLQEQQRDLQEQIYMQKQAAKQHRAWLDSIASSQRATAQRDETARLRESMAISRIVEYEQKNEKQRKQQGQQQEVVQQIRQLRNRLAIIQHGSQERVQIQAQIQGLLEKLEILQQKQEE